jgi:beta-lactamase class A
MPCRFPRRPARLLPLLAAIGACAPAIRPLPLPAPGEASAPALRALETDLRAIIRLHASGGAEVSVALRDLRSGDSLLIDARTPMHAASTMKVPVMLELFRRAEAGELSLDDPVPVHNEFRSIADGSTYSLPPEGDSDAALHARIGERLPLRELIHRMIARSGNLATNLVVDLAGPERIERALAEIGAQEMRVLRGVEDGPAFRRGLNNTTTAYGLMRVLEAVAGGTGLSPRSTAEMLAILEEQEFRDMIPAGVPEGVRVGSKSGWISGIQHDGAIVHPPGRPPYVLVVLTRGFPDHDAARQVGRHLSRRVWAELGRREGV